MERLTRRSLNCTVTFPGQRDANKRVERFFLGEMVRRPDAKRTGAASDLDRTVHAFTDGKARFSYFDGQRSKRDGPQIALDLLTIRPLPEQSMPRTFATPERSYRLFIDLCVARFQDIEGIAERLSALGWKDIPKSPPNSQGYSSFWELWDPFTEMGPFGFDLTHSNTFRECTFSFDTRAGFPMERLIRDYGLVLTFAPYFELIDSSMIIACLRR